MSSHDEASQPFRWHYAEFDDSNFQIRGRDLFFIVILFSIILLLALLFLYGRWVCRFYSSQPPIAALLAVDRKKGLDADTINSFPIVMHKKSIESFDDKECCICLGIFGVGDKLKVLPPCQHCFHPECVDKWFATQSSCPLCRASLLVDSPV